MAYKIAIANQKGGMGKTALTIAIGLEFARRKKRVLLIDNDPQCNLSDVFITDQNKRYSNFGKLQFDNSLYMLYHGHELKVESVDSYKKLDIIPSDSRMMENEIVSGVRVASFFEKLIEKVDNDYDYIFIDTRPSSGNLLDSSLKVADYVLCPSVPASEFIISLDSLHNDLMYSNAKLLGTVLTRFETNYKVHNDILNYISNDQELFEKHMFFDTVLGSYANYEKAKINNISLKELDAKHKSTEQIDSLIREIQKRIKLWEKTKV